MGPVTTRYVERDGAALAYQVVGDGPTDVLTFYEFMLHLDLCWMDPDAHHNMEAMARFARSAAIQRRGVGLSDRVGYMPTLDQQADDVLAVMDAVGMKQATLVGILGTCGPVALVAAKAPERVTGLVLLSPLAEGAGLDEPIGWNEDEARDWMSAARQAVSQWGSGALVDLWDPALASAHNRRLMGLLERSSATPAVARAHYEWLVRLDLRDVFRAVRVPTRVLSVPSTPIPEAATRSVSQLVPDATFHELPASSPGASLGQSFAHVAAHVEEVATGSWPSVDADRFLGTVLFTDVVGSTELLARVGDARYRELRAAHEGRVRLAVEENGGRLVNVSGDGTLSVFEGPFDAVTCAGAIRKQASDDGLAVRCGVHAGALERDGLNVTGMTVHVGARVGAAAEPGEVLVSSTIRDLLIGSGLEFTSRGDHKLKGVPGSWRLFSTNDIARTTSVAMEESLQSRIDRLAVRGARHTPRAARAALRLAGIWERFRARS